MQKKLLCKQLENQCLTALKHIEWTELSDYRPVYSYVSFVVLVFEQKKDTVMLFLCRC